MSEISAQGPTLIVRLIEVSVKRELAVHSFKRAPNTCNVCFVCVSVIILHFLIITSEIILKQLLASGSGHVFNNSTDCVSGIVKYDVIFDQSERSYLYNHLRNI